MAAADVGAVEHQGWIAVTAKRAGWRVGGINSSYNSHVPDLLLLRPPEAIIVKAHKSTTARNGLSKDQQAWLDDANTVPGVEAHHWTPDDQDAIFARLNREPAGG